MSILVLQQLQSLRQFDPHCEEVIIIRNQVTLGKLRMKKQVLHILKLSIRLSLLACFSFALQLFNRRLHAI